MDRISFGMEDMPDNVLEDILCRLPETEILKCNLVCRSWKNLITRKSFWKKCYYQKDLAWNKVPIHILTKDEGWMVLYAQFRRKIFTKNYISNPSGKGGLEGWNIEMSGGDGWIVETEPIGCERLPMTLAPDSFLDPDDNHCFATSFNWCSKSYEVDLWDVGLTPMIMRVCLPLEIKCSQMYSARFDCGGKFKWELRLLNPQREVVRSRKAEMERRENTDWETAEFSFRFIEGDAEFTNQVRYLVFIHEGKDNNYWAGHYGMKFARACVTVRCFEENARKGFRQPGTYHKKFSKE